MGTPKLESLSATVAGHHSALRADLRREYNVELIDVWCGCLSWHALSDYVRWLPKTAALYQSMRMARPTKVADGALLVVDSLDALRFGTPEHVAELLLALLNRQEGRDWAEADKKERGPFEPTLPPGYSVSDDEADEEALAAYLAAMQPLPTSPEMPTA